MLLKLTLNLYCDPVSTVKRMATLRCGRLNLTLLMGDQETSRMLISQVLDTTGSCLFIFFVRREIDNKILL